MYNMSEDFLHRIHKKKPLQSKDFVRTPFSATWRKGWDSNPRTLARHSISNAVTMTEKRRSYAVFPLDECHLNATFTCDTYLFWCMDLESMGFAVRASRIFPLKYGILLREFFSQVIDFSLNL